MWSFGCSGPGFSQRIRSLSQENRASFTQHGRERLGRPCGQISATAGHHRGFGRFREFSACGRIQGTLEAPGIPKNRPLPLHITSRGRNAERTHRIWGSVTKTRDEGFPTSLNSRFHPNTNSRNQNNLILNPKIHHPPTKPKTSKAKIDAPDSNISQSSGSFQLPRLQQQSCKHLENRVPGVMENESRAPRKREAQRKNPKSPVNGKAPGPGVFIPPDFRLAPAAR